MVRACLGETMPRPLPSCPLPASPPRRPTSAAIAATPLKLIPHEFAAEAEQMLRAGTVALESFLQLPHAKHAMRLQGVEASELLQAASRSKLPDTKGTQGKHLERQRADAELRYSVQLLGQVIWESNLCAIAEQRALEAAALGETEVATASPPRRMKAPQQNWNEANTAGATPSSSSTGSRSLRSTSRTALAPSQQQYEAMAEPPPEVTGHLQTLPLVNQQPQATSGATNLCMSKQEKTRARLELVKEKTEQRSRQALEMWQAKERILNESWSLKQQRTEAVRERSRERNIQKELKHQHFKELERRRQAELLEAASAMEKKADNQVARVNALNSEISELMSSAAAVRSAVHEANRQQIMQQDSEDKRKKQEKAEKAHSEASDRRKQVLSAKSSGPPQLRAAREVARRQALRVERMRDAQREDLRERLERDSSVPPAATTSVLLASGTPTRTSTPPRVRPHSAGPYRTDPLQQATWHHWRSAAADDSKQGYENYSYDAPSCPTTARCLPPTFPSAPVAPKGPPPLCRRPGPGPAPAPARDQASGSERRPADSLPTESAAAAVTMVHPATTTKDSSARDFCEILDTHFPLKDARPESVEVLATQAGTLMDDATNSFSMLLDWAQHSTSSAGGHSLPAEKSREADSEAVCGLPLQIGGDSATEIRPAENASLTLSFSSCNVTNGMAGNSAAVDRSCGQLYPGPLAGDQLENTKSRIWSVLRAPGALARALADTVQRVKGAQADLLQAASSGEVVHSTSEPILKTVSPDEERLERLRAEAHAISEEKRLAARAAAKANDEAETAELKRTADVQQTPLMRPDKEEARVEARARSEAARLEEEQRAAAERAEAAHRAEEQRAEAERAEALRKAEEEKERAAVERAEALRRVEEERAAAERAEALRRVEEEKRAAAERAEALRRAEEERVAAERAEALRRAEEERAEAERIAALRRAEEERAAAERLEAARRAEEERLAAERVRDAAFQQEKHRLILLREAEAKAEQERLVLLAARRAEEERQAAAQALVEKEAERLRQEAILAEEERLATLRAEANAIFEKVKLAAQASQKAEEERKAVEASTCVEQEKLNSLVTEQKRLAAEAAAKVEHDRAALAAEEERLAAIKAEQARISAEALEKARAEEARLAEIEAEEERLAKLRAEADAIAAEVKLQASAAMKAKEDRLAAEAAVKAEESRLGAIKAAVAGANIPELQFAATEAIVPVSQRQRDEDEAAAWVRSFQMQAAGPSISSLLDLVEPEPEEQKCRNGIIDVGASLENPWQSFQPRARPGAKADGAKPLSSLLASWADTDAG